MEWRRFVTYLWNDPRTKLPGTSRLLLLSLRGNKIVILQQVFVERLSRVTVSAVDDVTVGRHELDLAACRCIRSTTSPCTEVGLVEELQEESHHGPGVVESDRVVQVRIVAVCPHELVVGRVSDDRNKLNLQQINNSHSLPA